MVGLDDLLIALQRRRAICVDVAKRPLRRDAPYSGSYFGGLPLLPSGILWPKVDVSGDGSDIRSQTFLGQIDLADLPIQARKMLPRSGVLLFFADTRDEVRDMQCRVIYVDKKDLPDVPRMAPDDLMQLNYDVEPDQWLDDTDPLTKVDFRYNVQFAPFSSISDSEDGAATWGWKTGSAYEQRHMQYMLEQAAELQRRLLSASGLSEFDRAPAEIRINETGILSDFRGGPYTWADVRLWVRAMDIWQRLYLEPPEQVRTCQKPSVLLALIDEVRPHFEEVVQIKEALRQASLSHDEWAPVPADFKLDILERLNGNSLSGRGFSESWKAVTAAISEENRNAREAGRAPEFDSGLIYYTTPRSLNEVVMRYSNGIMPFNVKRAFHEGVDAESIYPKAVVDTFGRSRSVGQKIRQDIDPSNPFFAAPPLNQMFGYGTSVQSAPYEFSDKVLLLQLFGGHFRWLRGVSCVFQIWISPSDLKQRRFDKVFATRECN